MLQTILNMPDPRENASFVLVLGERVLERLEFVQSLLGLD